MDLLPYERDYYVVSYTTDPPLTGTVQASFDDGETWVDGTATTVDVDGEDVAAWSWLVAGPDYDATTVDPAQDPDDTVATIESTVVPLLRLADDPVLDGKQGPRISIKG